MSKRGDCPDSLPSYPGVLRAALAWQESYDGDDPAAFEQAEEDLLDAVAAWREENEA